MTNIAKGEALLVCQFMNGFFPISTGKAFENVDMFNHSCTCREWQMVGIPCEHACATILLIGKNVADFVDDWYKFPKQELIYLGSFHGIEANDMPSVDSDGIVHDLTGKVFFSLQPPHSKRPSGRPRKKRIESQFQDKRTIYCLRCNSVGHNWKTCKNPLA